jgi:GTP-binding protein Era
MGFRSGFVAIIGRPNVGKSTLLNQLLGTKLAIVTPKPQTTRNRISGIVSWADCQIVFLDTPGIHEGKGTLNRFMVDEALNSLLEADMVCFMIDAEFEVRADEIRPEELGILDHIRNAARPAVLVINKIDKVGKNLLLPVLDRYAKAFSFAALVPVSALAGDGVDSLVSEVKQRLPEGERMYPEGQLTDRSRDFIISEFIREKAFLLTHQEVPYSVAVVVDAVQERPGKDKLLYVAATLHVERDSQKGILVGRRGEMIREIGSQARTDLEAFLKRRIFLELRVRVEKDWTRSDRGLTRVGFTP